MDREALTAFLPREFRRRSSAIPKGEAGMAAVGRACAAMLCGKQRIRAHARSRDPLQSSTAQIPGRRPPRDRHSRRRAAQTGSEWHARHGLPKASYRVVRGPQFQKGFDGILQHRCPGRWRSRRSGTVSNCERPGFGPRCRQRNGGAPQVGAPGPTPATPDVSSARSDGPVPVPCRTKCRCSRG
jgi:hypothetical protein